VLLPEQGTQPPPFKNLSLAKQDSVAAHWVVVSKMPSAVHTCRAFESQRCVSTAQGWPLGGKAMARVRGRVRVRRGR
jgi:hypothetical protein